MNIAIAKGDYGIVGGFEIVVTRLADGLRARGHRVEVVEVDAAGSVLSRLPISVPESAIDPFREFFFHLSMIARFEALDLSGYDAVLCTQPGSYAVRHAHKVALFYHHARAFYDLQHVIEISRGHDPDLHRLATLIVRDVDARYLTPDLPILAGSRRVKERLAEFNGLTDSVDVFSCGIDEAFFRCEPVAFDSPLCVGRHEFPKRPELFVHAMYHLDGVQGRLLGTGSFTPRIQGIDAWLAARHLAASADAIGVARTDLKVRPPVPSTCAIDDDRLWWYDVVHTPDEEFDEARRAVGAAGGGSRVTFLGRLAPDDLMREYATALCIVCPAYDEDFGLTCVEAMACGKPVIACRDGGGYVELIDDGVDGFLVEPTGPAIAAAIERLRDVSLARTMGARGRQKAQAFTWTRAIEQVEHALLAAC